MNRRVQNIMRKINIEQHVNYNLIKHHLVALRENTGSAWKYFFVYIKSKQRSVIAALEGYDDLVFFFYETQ